MLSIALVIGQHVKYHFKCGQNGHHKSQVQTATKVYPDLYKQKIPGKQVSHLELQMYYNTWTTKIHNYMYKKIFILKVFFTVHFF